MAETHVTGLAELQKFLDQLPAKIERNVMRGALRAGVNVIKNQARASAPVGQPSQENVRLYGGYAGALRDSIRVTTRVRGGRVTASVKAGGKNSRSRADVYYAHMIEFGTRAHFILPRKARGWLSFLSVFARKISHPGARPRPFMRPALDSQAQNAVIAAAEYMKKRLATKEGLDTGHIKIEGDEP